MAFIVISADQTTAVGPASNDFVIIKAGVVVSAGDGIAGFGAGGLNVRVDGIAAGTDNGAELGGGSIISIGATGALIGRSAGLWLSGAGTVANNAGTIQSYGDGVSFADAAVVLNETSDVVFTNSGALISRLDGIQLYGSTLRTTFMNSGTITAGRAGFVAAAGVVGFDLDNSGSIIATAGPAIDFSLALAGGLKVRNDGLIKSTESAILSSVTGVDTIVNDGTITGSVSLFGGDDKVTNRGDIFGTVDLGAGIDLFDNRSGGEVTRVLGGADNDRILGGAGDEILDGGSHHDFIDGGYGDDQIYGGSGLDTLRGSFGDDYIDGGSNNDLIDGGSGNDNILGGGENDEIDGNTGHDTIDGGNGNDKITGYSGNDILTGGAGEDQFIFNAAFAKNNVDRIVDFNVEFDTIVLDNEIFTGLATGTLTAGAFRVASTALDATDRIVYNSTTGALYFDADGSGSIAAVHFANLSTGLAMTAGDFLVI